MRLRFCKVVYDLRECDMKVNKVFQAGNARSVGLIFLNITQKVCHFCQMYVNF